MVFFFFFLFWVKIFLFMGWFFIVFDHRFKFLTIDFY